MALLLRASSTFAKQSAHQVVRHMSSAAGDAAAVAKHAKEAMSTWKKLSLAVCLPACGYLFYYNFVAHPMHEEQRQFVAYPHLRIRTKRFPWTESDLTLFHNPHTNPGPDSGEHEEEHGASAPFLTRLFASGMDTAEQTREKREAHLRYIQAKSQAYIAQREITAKHELRVPLTHRAANEYGLRMDDYQSKQ
ncbi:hypothetical protein CAOG_07345 [Capsaspora owczarzaki ATCC 30864]|uniref:hypothetical protein n=1 Tax=Capsaspora owczarzaki (strain ATCC 30864) TaxID=595528 RepID=UPI00035212F5|nr:hypothetical protein CAOG_07345 [Capsaspora owczarzaki ATCC 30864]|eukprot:XP_004343204.2 hypothetical protein CAOG_07345 [Capsaspora owczarzaki ATCC 30864]